MKPTPALFALAAAGLLLNACGRKVPDQNAAPTDAVSSTSSQGAADSDLRPGTHSPSRYNLSAPQKPDGKITPGDTLPVTAKDICVSGYSKKVRNVPQSVKEQAYKNYSITHREKGEYEVDHLVSLQLGGSNSIRNLWPQSFQTKPWNAHVKDQLENELHREICTGQMDISAAQKEIASDWIASYKKHFKTAAPLADRDAAKAYGQRGKRSGGRGEFVPQPVQDAADDDTPATKSATAGANASGKVWVNLSSKVFWRPGTQYYGKTKRGKYMTEAEAMQAGYHAAQ